MWRRTGYRWATYIEKEKKRLLVRRGDLETCHIYYIYMLFFLISSATAVGSHGANGRKHSRAHQGEVLGGGGGAMFE